MSDLFPPTPEEARAKRANSFLTSVVWTHGVALLVAHGMKTENARAFLALRLRDVGRERLILGIAHAIERNVADARAYLGAIKSPKREAATEESDGVMPWMES